LAAHRELLDSRLVSETERLDAVTALRETAAGIAQLGSTALRARLLTMELFQLVLQAQCHVLVRDFAWPAALHDTAHQIWLAYVHVVLLHDRETESPAVELPAATPDEDA